MNIPTFRDALKVLGAQYWRERQIHLAPVIRHPFSNSITEDFASALSRDHAALERIITPTYLVGGNSKFSVSQAERLGSSLLLPFPETIFHVHVGPEHVHQTDALTCAIDTGAAAYPDVISLGLFWQNLSDIAVVLSHRNGLQKHLSLWDLRKQRELTAGAMYEEAMLTLEQMVTEAISGFGAEQRAQMTSFADTVLAVEMARLRPLLFRIFDPARTFVRVRPVATPTKSSEWLASRTHFEIMTEADLGAVGADKARGNASWIRGGMSFQVLDGVPSYILPPKESSKTPPAFAIGKERADDNDWIFILAATATNKGRWGRLAGSDSPGVWRLTVAVDPAAKTGFDEIPKDLVGKAISELAALKLIAVGEMTNLTIAEEPLRCPRAIVMFEACTACLAAGRGKHVTYSPICTDMEMSAYELGKFFDAFRSRWEELRPDLRPGH